MIRQSHIRKFQARYHRNGVAGNAFYYCQFLWLDGRKLKALKAIVFEDRGDCAVFTDTIEDRYRGDDFEPALREAIELMLQAQPDMLYKFPQEK